MLIFEFDLLPRPLLVVAVDDVDDAGDIERSSFDLSLPLELRPLLLLRELVRRLLVNQSSSYSASVFRLFLRFLKLRSSSSSSSNIITKNITLVYYLKFCHRKFLYLCHHLYMLKVLFLFLNLRDLLDTYPLRFHLLQ